MAHDRMTRPLSPEATPEPPTRSSSTDHLPQLRGSFHSDGTVHFEADNAHITPSLQTGPRSLQTALKAAELSRSQSNNSISSVASESSEDYDSIRPDPRTLVVGQGGGGLLGNEVQTPRVGSNKTFEEANTSAQQPTLRLQKIPVTLNETKKKGQYVLTADDDALRKILRRSVERVCMTVGGSFLLALIVGRKRIPKRTRGGASLATTSSLADLRLLTGITRIVPNRHFMVFL